MLGGEPVVEGDRPRPRSPGQIRDEGNRGCGRADDVDPSVEVDDHLSVVDPADDDLDPVDPADGDGTLLDVFGHGHLRHDLLEPAAQRVDVRLEVESSLAAGWHAGRLAAAWSSVPFGRRGRPIWPTTRSMRCGTPGHPRRTPGTCPGQVAARKGAPVSGASTSGIPWGGPGGGVVTIDPVWRNAAQNWSESPPSGGRETEARHTHARNAGC